MSTAELSAPTYVGPEHDGVRMTADEFDAIEAWDERYRYELVRGVLVVSPAAGPGERSPNDELGYLIRMHRDTHDEGRIVDDTMPEQEIRIGDNRRRIDRAIWIGLGRPPRPGFDIPSVAIEFVSRSKRDRRRDYTAKRREYAAAGVKQYWVIDRYRRKMTVYEGAAGQRVILEGEVFTTGMLPGFELPLARLLRIADQYAD
jgi:Uma2 family endonuclease